jgi:hypothetical protein
MCLSLMNREEGGGSDSDSPSDNDSFWAESHNGNGDYCGRECIKTRWKNRYRTKTETATTTTTDFFVTTETRLYTTTATTTVCDKWNRQCGPRIITKTETKVYPTTVFCPHGCPRRGPTNSICTRTELATEIQRIPIPCRRHPCPPKPETTTVTKYFPKKVPYPCVITTEVTVTNKASPMCTSTQTRLKFRRQPQMQCHRRPCGPETITETIVDTVTHACVKTRTVPVVTTVAIIQPIIKPVPVRCTVTEVETLRETVTCRQKPCIPSTLTNVVTHTKVQPCIVKETVQCTVTELETLRETVTCRAKPCVPTTITKVITQTKVQPCVVKETDVITESVPVTWKVPVMCTETETKTKIREVPVRCTKYPCGTTTITEYIPVEVVRTCKETETVTKRKPFPVREVCTVTETATKLKPVPGRCNHGRCTSSTVTEYVSVIKTVPCIRKETETDFVTKTSHHHHHYHDTETETETATATATATITKHHLRWTTTTKNSVCKVTETETLTQTREKHCVKSCTSTKLVTVTKTKPCVVTETLPLPYPVPTPYPYTKEIPVPYPVPVPVERKPVRPCKEIPCPLPPPCQKAPCSPPPTGPCYEKSCSLIAIPPKAAVLSRRCDDDQCPPTPPGLPTQSRQCDASGVILRFDSSGLLRDELNRIGYIADNYQFQFDLPVQAGGYGEKDFGEYKDPNSGDVYLTWRGKADFYKCQSGNFDNLYSQSIAGQCRMTRIMLFRCVAS